MSEHDVTILLQRIRDGETSAVDQLMPLVFAEVRELAARHLARERRNHTLQPTALVNEAYLRLVGHRDVQWQDRAHFLGAASTVIHRVLVDHARARQRLKRGGGLLQLTLTGDMTGDGPVDLDLLALDEALDRLGASDPEEREVVELRFFGGMSVPEVAELLGVSQRTIERRWTFARAWLFRELRDGRDEAPR